MSTSQVQTSAQAAEATSAPDSAVSKQTPTTSATGMAARGGGAAATTKSTIVAEVKRLMREGKTRAEIIAATGCSRQMYAYASKTLVRKPKPLGRPIKYP